MVDLKYLKYTQVLRGWPRLIQSYIYCDHQIFVSELGEVIAIYRDHQIFVSELGEVIAIQIEEHRHRPSNILPLLN